MIFLVIGLSAALAAASIAEAFWPVLEIVNVFAPWWGGAAILSLGLIAIRSHGIVRAISFALALVVAVRLIVLLAPLVEQAKSASRQQPDLRVISLNMWKDNEDRAFVTSWLNEQDADVVILMEAPIGSEAFDNALRNQYPYQYACTRSGRCSTRILSKWPALAVHHHADQDPENRRGLSALSARLSVAGRPVTIVAAHMDRPWPLEQRGERLDLMAEALRVAKPPILFTGDFNSAPWTVGQSRMTSAAQLRLVTGSRGTWPAWSPIALLPLDQAYVSPCIGANSVELGPNVGSDHFPLVMAFDRKDCDAD
ncbi:endonuclease/exonuclease/phosphatase family protein [Croceicoccus gelatinilyticus]|uniref:endonuclease/exonuclease/phosphatase family protein n=1 Tax=Croceicoccus gelatinilyticus TaxID=2835536 RepID=UPI001BD0F2B8|nr:endonuclease/exonuclease/phosphatase family protein [Croceicoccus gelatinilyticus]